MARLAQSAERKALNLVIVGSSPTVGVLCGVFLSLRMILQLHHVYDVGGYEESYDYFLNLQEGISETQPYAG